MGAVRVSMKRGRPAVTIAERVAVMKVKMEIVGRRKGLSAIGASELGGGVLNGAMYR